MEPNFKAFAITALVKWVLHTGLLWGMIRVQRLNYHAAGLIGLSLLATLIQFAPVVGPILSYVVLIFCLRKCTGAAYSPDLFFTATITRAVMVCLNLWVLGSLLGPLHYNSAQARRANGFDWKALAASGTPAPKLAAPGAGPDGDEAEDNEAATNSTLRGSAAKTNTADGALPVAARKPGPSIRPGDLTLKGIWYNPKRPLATVAAGGKSTEIGVGSALTVQTKEGPVELHCIEVARTQVTFHSERGETVQLFVH